MERNEGDQNPTNFQALSMPESHHHITTAGGGRNHQNESYNNPPLVNYTDFTPDYQEFSYPCDFDEFPIIPEFERLSLSASPYVAAPPLPFSGQFPVNGGGSILQNNPSFGFSNGRLNSVQRESYFYDSNLNGSYYDFDSVYHQHWYNSGTLLNETGDFNLPMSRVHQNGSIPRNRNRARSANGTNLQYGAETSNGFHNNPQTSFLRQLENFSSLEDFRGNILLMAKDQNGCRFLRKKIEEGKPEEIQMIYSKVIDHVCELMVHQFGNCLIKKLVEVCSEQQITQLLLLVTNDHKNLLEICLDVHGTRVVQKMIEHLTTPDQRSLFVSVLRRITFTLTKNLNGHHVIQHCCKYFPIEVNKHILNVVADNCLDIATDRSGCCVLQQCVGHAQGEPLQRLVAQITANALFLSGHPYGNFVVQYVLGLDIPRAKEEIVARLTGRYVFLSVNKYGSNVVEKCLRECKGHLVPKIINEIIYNPNFLMVLQDPYGNYVVQSALSESTGAVRNKLVSLIREHRDFLQSHPYGKRILARTKVNRSYRYSM